MPDIYEEIVKLRNEGRRSAIATIIRSLGSSPRKQGAKMLVKDDGTIIGTMGGGAMEARVIEAAMACMAGGASKTMQFDLSDLQYGLLCGGMLDVYIEPVLPDPRIVVLGAGHVGKALAKVASMSGFRVSVADDREEFASRHHFPDAELVLVSGFESAFTKLAVDPDTFVVIATRGHVHDFDAVRAALGTSAGYIGLLGSKRKKAALHEKLKDEGFSDEEIGRVIIPAGLPIGSVTPEEIAVSIIAQIIQLRRGNASPDLDIGTGSGVVEKDGVCQTDPPARR